MPPTTTPPRLKRKWVKLVGSDIRLVYPQKRLDSPPDCKCGHPIHPHFHFEDDKDQEPKKVAKTPTLFEANGNGTYTQWSFDIYGPVGHTGTLKEGDAVEPLKGRKDFNEALRLERLFDWSMVRQAGMVAVMGGSRSLNPFKLAKAARRRFRRRWGVDVDTR
jgi:hypothetical protein